MVRPSRGARYRINGTSNALLSTAAIGDVSGLVARLERAGGVGQEIGSDDVRGEPTVHYRYTFPAVTPPRQVATMGDGGTRDSVYDLWADGQHRLRRFRMMLGPSDASEIVETEFFDFGVPVSIEAPPADQVEVNNPDEPTGPWEVVQQGRAGLLLGVLAVPGAAAADRRRVLPLAGAYGVAAVVREPAPLLRAHDYQGVITPATHNPADLVTFAFPTGTDGDRRQPGAALRSRRSAPSRPRTGSTSGCRCSRSSCCSRSRALAAAGEPVPRARARCCAVARDARLASCACATTRSSRCRGGSCGTRRSSTT